MRRRTARTLLLPLFALLLGLLAAPPSPAAQPGAPHVTKQKYAGYLFAYFTGEGTADGEQIRYALSRGNDPLHWRELNAGKPVLTSELGEKGLRDPFVIRSPEGDKFYLIATDLKMYRNSSGSWDYVQRHGSKSIMIWESTDLVHWTDQRLVKVSPDTAGNTWAPEAYWDESLGEYVVFWASKLYAEDDPDHTGSTYNKMLYATTKDFRTFSEPKVWDDPGYSVIDSTVIKNKGSYYRYTKDERDPTLLQPLLASSSPGRSRPASPTPRTTSSPTASAAARSTAARARRSSSPTPRTSGTCSSTSTAAAATCPSRRPTSTPATGRCRTDYQLPASPRHGTVMPVTQAEYDRLLAAYPVSPTSVVDATARGQKGYAVVTEASSKVVLPMKADADLSGLAPRLWVGAGATVTPASGTRRDFRKPQKYTVTAADGTQPDVDGGGGAHPKSRAPRAQRRPGRPVPGRPLLDLSDDGRLPGLERDEVQGVLVEGPGPLEGPRCDPRPRSRRVVGRQERLGPGDRRDATASTTSTSAPSSRSVSRWPTPPPVPSRTPWANPWWRRGSCRAR